MYASYVVKFVYFYLRIILDKEVRIAQIPQLRQELANNKSNKESSSKADSNKDKLDSNNTKEDNST
jgi:hypothetical protein